MKNLLEQLTITPQRREVLLHTQYISMSELIIVNEVLDNFDRCLKNIEDDSVKEGILLIKNQLLSIFAKNGIKPMEIKEGDEFNTDYHEAVSVIDAGEEMKNKVVAVTDTGYTYSDKVLRYAKVIVGQ